MAVGQKYIVLQAIASYGAKLIGESGKASQRHVLKIFNGQTRPSDIMLTKLYAASHHMKNKNNFIQEVLTRINALITSKATTYRKLAVKLDMDASNLAKILSGSRNASTEVVNKLNDISKII